MKRKPLPPRAKAIEYASLMKIVPFASERLRFNALTLAWHAGYREGRAAARRARSASDAQ